MRFALPLFVVAAIAVQPISASLIYDSIISTTGVGPGTVDTVLILQARGASTDATGCVGRDSGGDTFEGCSFVNDTVQQGQSQTRLISTIDASTAADLRIVFNSIEPAGGDVILNDLALTFYSSAGAALGSFSLDPNDAPLTLTNTFTGAGKAGFVFRLDPLQASSAEAFFSSANYIGLGASVSDSEGGFEHFYLTAAEGGGGGGGGEIPEPQTYVILGSGLVLLGFLRRRKAA